MQLFHTSPTQISDITDDGRFSGFLFFAGAAYVMTAGDFVSYEIEIDDDKIIDAERLFYHKNAARLDALVQKVVDMVGCDDDTAEELIAQRIDVHSIDSAVDAEDLGEVSWDIQHITAEAAVLLGFRGVAMNDEQGRAYLIDMRGRAHELMPA